MMSKDKGDATFGPARGPMQLSTHKAPCTLHTDEMIRRKARTERPNWTELTRFSFLTNWPMGKQQFITVGTA